jgi:hypothetical protein
MALETLLEGLSAVFASLFAFLLGSSFFESPFDAVFEASNHVTRFAFEQFPWL